MSASALSPKPDTLPGRGSIWRHKKGAFYRVANVSRHSERPDEWLITYDPIAGGDAWTRSLAYSYENQWPGFADNLGDVDRFTYVSGPRTWRDEPALPPIHELLDMLDNVSASADTMLGHFGKHMSDADRDARTHVIMTARDLCDRALRP